MLKDLISSFRLREKDANNRSLPAGDSIPQKIGAAKETGFNYSPATNVLALGDY